MYHSFSFFEIKPTGWLRRQLAIQANGLSGNLDKVWRDVRDSKWFGGDSEGWERVPYWLDGFIPLAYLLGDEDLIARADKYVNCILDRQEEDGWICPCQREERPGYDLWAYILVCKVLTLYAENTGSERAKDGLRRALYRLYTFLKNGEARLAAWGQFRYFELFVALLYQREQREEEWLYELGRMICQQGVDYLSFADRWKAPQNDWTLPTHIVNLMMAVKSDTVKRAFFGEEPSGDDERMWKLLEAYNGTAVGIITGDECLSGIGNNRGTELCAVAELMYSFETIYRLTGKRVWLDRLEKVAFNALPATLTEDMWAHQYVQQVNQIACKRFPSGSYFRTNSSDAHLFGLEPCYGCCTANFSQGWPKFAMNCMMRREENEFRRTEIHIAHLLPAVLTTKIGEANVRIEVESDYPFRMSAIIRVETDRKTQFDLSINIPSFAKTLTVDEKSVPVREKLELGLCIRGDFGGKYETEISFTDEPRLTLRPHDLCAAEYGPLVFSLPLKAEYKKIEYTRGGVERKFPYCDYELTSTDEWRYGFASLEFKPVVLPVGEVPFSFEQPPIALDTKLSRVAWDHANGYPTVANETPASDVALSEPEEARLIPYGCAKLRVTEMPLTK